MFLEAQEAVFRAAGIHGAVLTIDWRDIGPVHLDQETEGIEPMIYLFLGDFLRTIPVPRPFEGRGVNKGGEKEKKRKEGNY